MVPNAKSPPAQPLSGAEPLHNGLPLSSPEADSADPSERAEGGPDAHSCGTIPPSIWSGAMGLL